VSDRKFLAAGGNRAFGADEGETGKLLLLALLGLALAMALITTVEAVIFRAQRGDAIEFGLLLSGRLADWYTCAVLVPPLYWLTTRYAIEGADWLRCAWIHLAASAAAACLKFVFYVPLRRLLDPEYHGSIGGAIGSDFLGKLMFFWAVIGILHAIFFYRRARAGAEAVDTLRNRLAQVERGGTLAVPYAGGTRYLPSAEIDWIGAQGNYLQIHAGSERFLVRETMRQFSEKLDSALFVRVHRSAIVNLASVRGIERASSARYRLTLRNGDTVTSGKSHFAVLRALL
jgi:hypothetical protein